MSVQKWKIVTNYTIKGVPCIKFLPVHLVTMGTFMVKCASHGGGVVRFSFTIDCASLS